MILLLTFILFNVSKIHESIILRAWFKNKCNNFRKKINVARLKNHCHHPVCNRVYIYVFLHYFLLLLLFIYLFFFFCFLWQRSYLFRYFPIPPPGKTNAFYRVAVRPSAGTRANGRENGIIERRRAPVDLIFLSLFSRLPLFHFFFTFLILRFFPLSLSSAPTRRR